MAAEQELSSHIRRDPLFHFFLLPVVALNFCFAFASVVRRPDSHSAWNLILALAAIVAVFKVRLYALRVQDRVIRLEERLRLTRLLSPELNSRASELSEQQLIALRFASDAELSELVQKTLSGKLSGKEIKQGIRNWRPDYWRV